MVRVEDSVVMNFKVDGLGFRRMKEVVGQYQRWFVYDLGSSEVPGLAPLVAEYDGNGNLVAKYHHDGEGLMAMTRNNQSYWYGFEGIGTVRQLMGSQGQVVDAYTFDAWGNELTNPQSQVPNPFKYVGKHGYYLDTESALMLLGVRYYSATNGLFLSRDLIEGYGYSYAADNPARWMDPQGLQFEEPNNQTCSIVNGQRECAPSRGGKKPPKPKPKSCLEVMNCVKSHNPPKDKDKECLKNRKYDCKGDVAKRQISNEFIVCMLWQESSFNPGEETGSARGIGQIKPEAFEAVKPCLPCNWKYKDIINPNNWCSHNVKTAIFYLYCVGPEGYGTGKIDKLRKCEECLKNLRNKLDERGCKQCLQIVHP
jgi:RHS repeat-associated protein